MNEVDICLNVYHCCLKNNLEVYNPNYAKLEANRIMKSE